MSWADIIKGGNLLTTQGAFQVFYFVCNGLIYFPIICFFPCVIFISTFNGTAFITGVIVFMHEWLVAVRANSRRPVLKIHIVHAGRMYRGMLFAGFDFNVFWSVICFNTVQMVHNFKPCVNRAFQNLANNKMRFRHITVLPCVRMVRVFNKFIPLAIKILPALPTVILRTFFILVPFYVKVFLTILYFPFNQPCLGNFHTTFTRTKHFKPPCIFNQYNTTEHFSQEVGTCVI